ncbi:MAG: NAD(P)H-hydrate dehydratase [Oscillospiraceae bacterium]|nr:NAD(P)H-hydrate dehydratase [Oscillospiraceae bacterium]
MRLSSAALMKAADEYAIEKLNIPSLQLMETAAWALRDRAEAILGGLGEKRIAVFCGSGNNGGDGFAVARLLERGGAAVFTVFIGNPEKMTADCAHMAKLWGKASLTVDDELELSACDMIIDAMFGIGLNSALRSAGEKGARLINAARALNSRLVVLAADIPSGVAADSGLVPGEAVKADETVTFSRGKPGLFCQPGSAFAGKVTVVPIGIPDAVLDKSFCGVETVENVNLPPRDELGHKGSFGKTLLLCGSVGFTGAAWLSAEMAVRSGTGLVRVGCFENIWSVLAGKCAEAMPFPMDRDFKNVIDVLAQSNSCLIGPGLGQSEEAEKLLSEIIKNADCPLVIDADGINLLSRNIDLLKKTYVPVILTPHDGEFARLGGSLEKGRIEGARNLAKRTGAIVVLKGHTTVITDPNGAAFINTTGNSGLAKGGSGDVLAGLMTGLLAQGMEPVRAACVAVWIHGAAGDICAERLGKRAMTPTDVIYAAGEIMKKL